MAGDYKRQYKQLHDGKSGHTPYDLQLIGPPATLGISPTTSSNLHTYMHSKSLSDDNSDFNNSIIDRKTLFYLTSTLNASFQPDYDFTNTLGSEFSKEPSIDFIIKDIENHLGPMDAYKKYKNKLWSVIDAEIGLADCEFFSYNPDLASDPCAEDGCVWFFNFFFFNRKMKRIVFFTCRCTRKSIEELEENDDELMVDADSASYLTTQLSSSSDIIIENS